MSQKQMPRTPAKDDAYIKPLDCARASRVFGFRLENANPERAQKAKFVSSQLIACPLNLLQTELEFVAESGPENHIYHIYSQPMVSEVCQVGTDTCGHMFRQQEKPIFIGKASHEEAYKTTNQTEVVSDCCFL
jgi:hypothetical protein